MGMPTSTSTGSRRGLALLAHASISKRRVHVPESAREALRVRVRGLAIRAGLGLLATTKLRVARRPFAAALVGHSLKPPLDYYSLLL